MKKILIAILFLVGLVNISLAETVPSLEWKIVNAASIDFMSSGVRYVQIGTDGSIHMVKNIDSRISSISYIHCLRELCSEEYPLKNNVSGPYILDEANNPHFLAQQYTGYRIASGPFYHVYKEDGIWKTVELKSDKDFPFTFPSKNTPHNSEVEIIGNTLYYLADTSLRDVKEQVATLKDTDLERKTFLDIDKDGQAHILVETHAIDTDYYDNVLPVSAVRYFVRYQNAWKEVPFSIKDTRSVESFLIDKNNNVAFLVYKSSGGGISTALNVASASLAPFSVTATKSDNTKKPQNFWAKGYQAQWESQTQSLSSDQYYNVQAGAKVKVIAKFKNTGSQTWYNSPEDRQVCIALYKDPAVRSSWTGRDSKTNENYGTSDFQSTDWKSKYRIGCIQETEVKPGQSGTFLLNFSVPSNAPTGKFREDITLASGPYWMESAKETADPIGAAHIWVGFSIRLLGDPETAF